MPSDRVTSNAPLITSLAGLHYNLTLVIDRWPRRRSGEHMLSKSSSRKRGIVDLNRDFQGASTLSEGLGESEDYRYSWTSSLMSPAYLVVSHTLPARTLTLGKQAFFDWEFLAWYSTVSSFTLQKMRASSYAIKKVLSRFHTQLSVRLMVLRFLLSCSEHQLNIIAIQSHCFVITISPIFVKLLMHRTS